MQYRSRTVTDLLHPATDQRTSKSMESDMLWLAQLLLLVQPATFPILGEKKGELLQLLEVLVYWPSMQGISAPCPNDLASQSIWHCHLSVDRREGMAKRIYIIICICICLTHSPSHLYPG